MKTLVCEMCGSNDLLKEDGVFVCQNCRTKYTVEEAKRMMIDGTVDIAGVVKVDNSDNVGKHLQNARRAKSKEDWEETEKYYNLVEQEDPDNIEAVFYSAYAKAKRSLIEDDIYKRQQVFKMFCKSLSILDDNFDVANVEEEEKVIKDIADDLKRLFSSEFVYTLKKNLKGEVTENNSYMTYALFVTASNTFVETLVHITEKAPRIALYDTLLEFISFMRLLKPGSLNDRAYETEYRNAYEAAAGLSGGDSKYKKTQLQEEISKAKDKRAKLWVQTQNGCSNWSALFIFVLVGGVALFFDWLMNNYITEAGYIIAGICVGVGILFSIIITISNSAKVKKNNIKGQIADLDAEIQRLETELNSL